MQKCSNCLNQLNRKNIIKSIWLKAYAPIICEYCDTKYYINTSTRLILGLSIGGPLFFIKFAHGLNFLIIYIIWLALVIYLTPYYARYHIKDETEV